MLMIVFDANSAKADTRRDVGCTVMRNINRRTRKSGGAAVHQRLQTPRERMDGFGPILALQ